MPLPKLVVVSQHYPPDKSTTAVIMSTVAERLGRLAPVVVLSGSAKAVGREGDLQVIGLQEQLPAKGALAKRTFAELLFSGRAFLALLGKLKKGDVALTVTAPFLLPYAVVAAAKLKRARSVLIMHDLFPEVLVVAGVISSNSVVAKILQGMNRLMFHSLDILVTIGRDTEALICRYGESLSVKIRLIPNWATLEPRVRPITTTNPFRRLCPAPFIVGLSGNLGFTHDPLVVFEAARTLQTNLDIHFLMSGWGVGFERLKKEQFEAKLPNITFVDRVADNELEDLLSAADIWIVPYRRNIVGVSTPSRFYNLLAVGRPIVMVCEPEAEAARIVGENRLGWVVKPGRSEELAAVLKQAAVTKDAGLAERAVAIAEQFSPAKAMESYTSLLGDLLSGANSSEATA